jgi:hypothetical protein
MQCLDKDNLFVQKLYVKFQKCAICYGIVEDVEDKIVHFCNTRF